MAEPDASTRQVGGTTVELVGKFERYHDLIVRVRERAAEIGLSYRLLDEISGLSEGHAGKVLADLRSKQMGVGTLLAITRTLGIRSMLDVDPQRAFKPVKDVADRARIG
jgi:hypothetical protein